MENAIAERNFTAVYVEDSPTVRMKVLAMISPRFKQVYMAKDSEEALEKVRLYEPDILITDIVLPDKNGLQLAREVKEIKHNIQTIVVSSFNEPEYYQEAINVGVAQYVLKPCNFESLSNAVDICEQRILKEQKASQESTFLHILHQAIEQSSSMVEISDFNGDLVYVNSKITEVTGFSAEEMLGKTFEFIQNGRIPKDSLKLFWETLISGQEWRGELENQKKDGNLYWESVSIAPVKNEAGEFTHFVAVKEDITQRKQMERQLKKAYLEMEQRVRERTAELSSANQQLQLEINERKQMEKAVFEAYDLNQQLIASITAILIGVSADDKVTHWNKKAEETFGIPTSDAVGAYLKDLPIHWHWEGVSKEIKYFYRLGISGNLADIHYLRLDHNEGLLEFSFNLIGKNFNNNSSYILLGTDITHRKNIEAQTVFSQKMESIGQLAAGIAHEINTPIQYIGDNLRFLQEVLKNRNGLLLKYHDLLESNKKTNLFPELVADIENEIVKIDLAYITDETRKAHEQSLEGIERVAKIVRAMKDFSHPSQGDKVFSNINKALESTLTISRNEWKYVAELISDFEPDLPMVNCYIDSINQVFLNIIVNAADALREKMQQNQSGDGNAEKGVIRVKTWSDNAWVFISISDTGVGIPPAIINKVFDPFFTTKEVGKGTGQGLTIVHDVIVNKHQGKVDVKSEIGCGATFSIQLPIDAD